MMQRGVNVAVLATILDVTIGLQHSAMWSLHNGTTMAGWGTLTFDLSDPISIAGNYREQQIKALWPFSGLTVPQAKKCNAPVHHTDPSGQPFECITLNPAWETNWTAQWQQIQPLVRDGAVIGVFLGDEHLYFGLQVAEVKLVADRIRLDWPDAIIYMNEAPDIAMCNYRKDNTTVFGDGECLPQNIDWFGFDFYAGDSASWTAVEEAFRDHVYPRFSRTDQRVVPVTLGFEQGNITAAERANLDEFCTTNARRFLQFALRDHRVVGIFPFFWAGGEVTPSGGVDGNVGISNLPRCASTYRAIGEIIVAAGKLGTSLDPAHRPPTAIRGAFPEPQCNSPIPPSPSTWNWCSRVNPAFPRLARRMPRPSYH